MQLEAIVLDNHGGPCWTARANDYLEDFVSLAVIAGGQSGFDWLLDEIRVRLFPRIATGELEALVDKVLPDPLPYTSLALGKRHGVTVEQFERLDLSHIAPAGWSKRKLDAYRAMRRNSKVKDQRHASGEHKTRREMSIMQLKPWKLPGAPCSSRAGLYRLAPDVQDALVKRARAEAEMRR